MLFMEIFVSFINDLDLYFKNDLFRKCTKECIVNVIL